MFKALSAVLFTALLWIQPTIVGAAEKLVDSEGRSFKVNLSKYKNHNDALEVRIEAAGIPRFASKINPLLGFGRDTDENGKVDTWFFVTKNGMDVVVLEGQEVDGKDVLAGLLHKKYQSTLMMYVTTATTSIFSYLLLSINEGINIQEEYYRDWMDLEEVRLHFEKDYNELGSTYTWDQLQYQYELTSIGFRAMADKMDKFAKGTFFGYLFADLGLWITGGVVFNWGAKILAKVGLIASETAFVTGVKETLFGFFEKQKGLIQNRISTISEKLRTAKTKVGMKTAQKEVTMALTVTTYKMALKNTLKAQKVKSRLQIAIRKTLKIPANIVNGAKSEWKYIVMNSGVQIGSEAVARWDEIYDANPATMAKNLLTNPEVIENVGFMTTDTVMMTGISKSLKTTKAKFMASGAIAMTNSSIMNFAIKEEANLSRVALDTTWETLIGNAQVQLDLKALEYFEKMAQKKNNPKIKLVGYVIALVDMGVGYVAYSKVTSAVEKSEGPKVMLVPVLAEQ